MRKPIYLLILLSPFCLTACSSIMNNLPGVYSLEIQQGNIINQEMIDQLRPKMTKRQVLYIMGSSMLIDVFHQKRWDYLYSEQPGGEPRKQKRLALFFDGDELIGVQGDFRPSTLPVIRKSNESTVNIPPRHLEKTLWEKITGLFDNEPPITLEQETSSATNIDDQITESVKHTETAIDSTQDTLKTFPLTQEKNIPEQEEIIN